MAVGATDARALGIHHVSAIARDPQRNLDFYAGLLGLRLVKRTVNFDDPQSYHLYYGDELGTPGGIMTFFPWPGARQGRQGAGQVSVTSFAVTQGSLGFWLERLVTHGVHHEGPTRRSIGSGGTEQVISFRDHDGLAIELVASERAGERAGWGGAPGIPAEHAIRGFHSVTCWVEEGGPTEEVLVDVLGFRLVGEQGTVRRYATGDGGPGALVDIRAVGGFLKGLGGAGTVHHVAFTVADDEAELELRERAVGAGLDATPVRDRLYFRSVYFREPGGVLYELATRAPGFTVDEPAAHLGESLMLPPWYEAERAGIEALLPAIHLPAPRSEASILAAAAGPEDVGGEALGHVHRYIAPSAEGPLVGATTLLLLHGTGGDEEDLIPLGRELLTGAGLLSPRGNVLERGAPRFFRRLAEGVLDQEDLARRTADLASFVEGAIRSYQLDREGVVAVGFSNGANIAASMLFRNPGLLRGAVLLSPMLPFEPESLPDLRGTSVFIGAGRSDPLVPVAQVERLAELLRLAGAEVELHLGHSGHAITGEEVAAAQEWLTRLSGS